MSEDYKNEFDKGYQFAIDFYDPFSGKLQKQYEGIMTGAFAEGLLSGRSEKIDTYFGKFKHIHWENGKPIVNR